MGKLLPQPQIGTTGGTLIWALAVMVVVVFLFTTGLGPVLIALAIGLVIVFILWVILQRLLFWLKRGSR